MNLHITFISLLVIWRIFHVVSKVEMLTDFIGKQYLVLKGKYLICTYLTDKYLHFGIHRFYYLYCLYVHYRLEKVSNIEIQTVIYILYIKKFPVTQT